MQDTDRSPTTTNRLLVGAGIFAALYIARDVLIPITLAILLSFILAPLVRLCRHIRIGRVLSVLIPVFVVFLLVVGIGSVLGNQIAQLTQNIPQYMDTIQLKISSLTALVDRATSPITKIGEELEKTGTGVVPKNSRQQGQPGPSAGPIAVEIHQAPDTPLQIIQKISFPLLGPLATAAVVIVFTIFILLQREDLRDRLIRLSGPRDLQRTTAAINEAARSLSRLLLMQTLVNAAFGLAVGLGLWAIGVPNAILWGAFGMLLRFVPYVGALIAAALPLTLAAAVDPGWSMFVKTLMLYGIVETLMGQVVEPTLYGHTTGLSPIAIVMSATFWTWMWGPIGLFLSTPLTICLAVLGRHVGHLEFLDILFGDKPALTPIQSFYQRVLAGDPAEAAQQAEIYLKDHSLAEYYDDIALRGLELAVLDERVGSLPREKLSEMRNVVLELIDDLSDHDANDERPSPPASPGLIDEKTEGPREGEARTDSQASVERPTILCVAGRNPLDEAAAAMLAQLLTKRGMKARVEPHQAVSSTNIFKLDTAEITLVCLSYLAAEKSPAHVRFLIRRLRRIIPKAVFIAGFWSLDDSEGRGRELSTEAGTELYATNLRQVIAVCENPTSAQQQVADRNLSGVGHGTVA
jgi:predicted PurR-regulated permease PerM